MLQPEEKNEWELALPQEVFLAFSASVAVAVVAAAARRIS
jgi:hypothetical protein